MTGNYNECAQLSAVIVKANTNAANPNTRAVMFHLGKYIPTGVPDTYGFSGIDAAQTPVTPSHCPMPAVWACRAWCDSTGTAMASN